MVGIVLPAGKPHTGIEEVKILRKPDDEIVNNSAAMQDDDDIQLSVAANEVWYFKLFNLFRSSFGAAIKFGWSVPAGTTMLWVAPRHLGETALTEGQLDIETGSGFTEILVHHGIIKVGETAGTVKLQWAQQTAEDYDTKLYENTHMICWRVV